MSASDKIAASVDLAPLPAHVPPSAVYDFDHIMAPVGMLDPQRDWARRLSEQAGGIFYTRRNGGLWVVRSAAIGNRILRDPETFSATQEHQPARRFEPALLPGQADPPDHREYRRALNTYFSAASMKRIEPDIRAYAIELMEELKPNGRCEFVADFAERFPIAVFLRMVEAPMSDRHDLLRFAAMFTRSGELASKTAGTRELAGYIRRLLEQRRDGAGEDVLSLVMRSSFYDRPMNDDELLGIGVMLFLAGLDTVKSVLSFMILYLARHPDQYRELVEEPALIDSAAEELLRISGVALPERGVARDTEIDDVRLKQGDRIVLFVPFMGFDPELNDDPYRVDLRRGVSRHMIFGAGVHRCAGAHLARVETHVFLEEWVRRFPSFALDPDNAPAMGHGAVWTPDRVPIVWP